MQKILSSHINIGIVGAVFALGMFIPIFSFGMEKDLSCILNKFKNENPKATTLLLLDCDFATYANEGNLKKFLKKIDEQGAFLCIPFDCEGKKSDPPVIMHNIYDPIVNIKNKDFCLNFCEIFKNSFDHIIIELDCFSIVHFPSLDLCTQLIHQVLRKNWTFQISYFREYFIRFYTPFVSRATTQELLIEKLKGDCEKMKEKLSLPSQNSISKEFFKPMYMLIWPTSVILENETGEGEEVDKIQYQNLLLAQGLTPQGEIFQAFSSIGKNLGLWSVKQLHGEEKLCGAREINEAQDVYQIIFTKLSWKNNAQLMADFLNFLRAHRVSAISIIPKDVIRLIANDLRRTQFEQNQEGKYIWDNNWDERQWQKDKNEGAI